MNIYLACHRFPKPFGVRYLYNSAIFEIFVVDVFDTGVVIKPLYVRFEVGHRRALERHVGEHQRGDVVRLPFFYVGFMRKSFCFSRAVHRSS